MRLDRREFLRGAAGTGCAVAFGLKFFHFSDDPIAYAAVVDVKTICPAFHLRCHPPTTYRPSQSIHTFLFFRVKKIAH